MENTNNLARGEEPEDDRDDRIPMELHLNRVPNIFLGKDRNTEPRSAIQSYRKDDGSHGKVTYLVEPSSTAGDLTPDTLKTFVALNRMVFDRLTQVCPGQPMPYRFDFTLRDFAKYLHPHASRTGAWNDHTRKEIKKAIRKLQKVNIQLLGEWYDAKTDTHIKKEEGFSILSSYYIAESRRFKSGAEQTALELGYVEVARRIVDNIVAGHTSPLLADEINSIGSDFGRILYAHLDNRFAGIPEESTNTYRRLVKPLFQEDFPELDVPTKYRKQTLQRAGKHLVGKHITTGTITAFRIVTNKKGKGSEWLLEVVRDYKAPPTSKTNPFEYHDDKELKETATPFATWSSNAPDRIPLEPTQPENNQAEELDTRRNHFCHELAEQLTDLRSIGDYHAIYLDLYHHHTGKKTHDVEDTMRRWASEITKHLEHEGLTQLPTGGKLHHLYNAYCQQVGKPTYTARKTSPDAQNTPTNDDSKKPTSD